MMLPLHDRVLVEPLPAEEVTPGGLFIPETNRKRPTRGKVLAVGSGARAANGQEIPMCVEVGDEVLYGKYSGAEVVVDGKECVIMREDDIFAVEYKEVK